jgi:hypothetical protein
MQFFKVASLLNKEMKAISWMLLLSVEYFLLQFSLKNISG